MSITSGSVRATTNAFPASSNFLGAMTTTWSAMVFPSLGRLGSLACNPPGTAIQFQPPSLRADAISNTKVQFSCSSAVNATNGMDGNSLVTVAIRSFWPWVKYRCLRYCTSLCSAASIFDCCFALIPSSKPNNSSVQAASIATPPTTSTLASDHFGFSRTIPAATAKLAATAAIKSTTCGQNGSSEPEKKSLIFLYPLPAGDWQMIALAMTVGPVIKMALVNKMVLVNPLAVFAPPPNAA